MCGRYSLTTPMEAVRQLFDFPERPNLAVRVNIAPSQAVAAVRLGAEEAGERHFVWLRWGLIPSWAPPGAKQSGIGNRMINARAETIAEKPAFRAAFARSFARLIDTDTPGPAALDLSKLPFRRVPPAFLPPYGA